MRLLASKKLGLEETNSSRLKKAGIEITEIPFIRTKNVQSNVEWPVADWIFFSSKNSYFYSIENSCPIHQYKIAAVGEQTAEKINADVLFIGKTSDTNEVGKQLRKLVGNDSILFPISTRSLLTVADCFPEDQKIILPLYSTELIEQAAPPHEGIIFTSPSNVEGYCLGNAVRDLPVISFGPSTTKACLSAGFKSITTLSAVNQENLVDTIITVFGRL